MAKHDSYDRMAKEYAIKERPHAWIQWKGTDVCMDIHCKCGEHLHLDGDFAYFITCKHCKRTYRPVPYVHLMELKPEEMDEVNACHYYLWNDDANNSCQEHTAPVKEEKDGQPTTIRVR